MHDLGTKYPIQTKDNWKEYGGPKADQRMHEKAKTTTKSYCLDTARTSSNHVWKSKPLAEHSDIGCYCYLMIFAAPILPCFPL